jgi:ABC-2 type transport system ATP-binding protein
MDPRTAVRSRRVAALLQSGALPVGATVRETVDLSRRLYGRTRSLAQVMGLAGLDEIAGRRCEQLSGGQRQRVRFGMAIAGRTELLFLDEPSVALDIAAREHLWSTVRRIAAEGTTVVFATHYLPEAERHADTVVLLRQGRVAASGPPDQIGTTTRTLRFRHPGADRDWLATVAGVHSVDVDRDQVELVSSDADATLAALYHRYQRLTGVSMTGSDLEDALLCPPADSGSTPQEGCR